MENANGQVNIRSPKNKKQIGKIGKGDKIYIEDYAVTYLNQITRDAEEKNGFAGLFGTCREIAGVKEYYIYAAIYQEADRVLEGGLPREAVQKIMRQRAELFTEYFFLGWALILKENSGTIWESCYRSRLETLMGKPEVLMTLRKNTCEEHFYLYPTEMPKETEGYFIFYEQNDAMQNFLVDWHGTNHADRCDGDSDRLAESCRNYYKEKKAVRLKKRIEGLALAASVFLLVFLTGVTINKLNGYEKMQEVTETTTQVMWKAVSGEETTEYDEIVETEPECDNISEEISEYNEVLEEVPGSDELSEEVSEYDEETNVTDEDIVEDIQETADSESLENEKISEVVLQEPAEELYTVYEVAQGDTLYDICIKFYGDLRRAPEICTLNEIENMDNILYGEKILLPQ